MSSKISTSTGLSTTTTKNTTTKNTTRNTIPDITSSAAIDDESSWCINGGPKHDWKRWKSDYTPAAKFKCERKGCGFFKKCWHKCEDKDTTCTGCHIIQHKRR